MSWVNHHQQYQLWSAAVAAPPAGWQGSWPPTAPVGYPGPPPVPAGVNPQAWTSGQWQFNPMFRGSIAGAQASFQAWAPHPSWGPHANGAAVNYNPYKRPPNPGNAEYWSTKLNDNGLGLHDMHIRDAVPKKTKENGVVHTPWVWVPKELCDSPEDNDSSELREVQNGRDRQEERTRGHDARSQSRAHDRSSSIPEAHRSSQQQQQQQRHELHDTHTHSSATRHQQPAAISSHQRHDSAVQPTDRSSRPEGGSEQDQRQERFIPPPVSSYSTYSQQQQEAQQQQQQQQRRSSRDVSPREASSQTRDLRTSPNPQPTSSSVPPPVSSASAAAAAAARSATAPAPLSEAFSSRQELQPTFSPSIVRTPNHYSSASGGTPTRRVSTDDVHATSVSTPSRRLSSSDPFSASTSTPTRRSSYEEASRSTPRPPVSPHAHGPIYAPPSNGPSRSNSLSKRHSTAPATTASSASTSTAPSLPFLANFSEEPVGLLSPLVGVPRTPGGSSPNGREITRSQTFPSFSGSSFDPIPEDPVSQPKTPRPGKRDSSRDPNRTPYTNARSPTRSSHVSPDVVPRQIARSQSYPVVPGAAPTRPSHPSKSPNPTRLRGPSPSRTARLSHNPLPQPPMPSSYHTSSASMSSSSYPVPPTSAPASSAPARASHAINQRKVRRGFWNRRGDHLLVERDSQFIVYAPRNLANPPELAEYPPPTEGFMDHRGQKVRYDPNVPELPDSLPHRGEPPSRPYEHFIQYI